MEFSNMVLIRHGEKDGVRITEIVYQVSQKSIGV